MIASNKLVAVVVSIGSQTVSVGTLSMIAVVVSLAGSSTTGSYSTGASAENAGCEGDGTFNTLSSVINSFSVVTSCCTHSTRGEASSSVSTV